MTLYDPWHVDPETEKPPAATDSAGRGRLARKLFQMVTPDIGPLRRHRDFRLLFMGQMISYFGNMITMVALPYQAYAITHSPLAVGLFGVVQLIPLLLLAFLGGALADAFDRRMLVQLTEFSLAVLSLLLLVNALLPHPQLWLLYVVAALAAGLDALQRPSLDAMPARLVEREELTAVGALSGLRGTLGMILGPAVAGLLIAGVGLAGAYGVDVATFVVSLLLLRLMRAIPPSPDAERPSLKGVIEGLRYAGSRPELLGTYLVDMAVMFFGMPTALFPALAVEYAQVSRAPQAATVLGLLYAAPAVGAFLASVSSGWTGRVHRHGLAVICAAGAWGLAITGMGLAGSLPLALLFLTLAGGADMISGIFRMVIWNKTIPDALRGRLASIELISYSSGPLLGDVESGAVATAFTPRISILSGGILSVVGVLVLAVALPKFRRYDDRVRPPDPVTQPEGGAVE